MVAQATSVDITWLEVVSQCVHGQQWCVTCLVTEIVAELTASQLRTAVGFGSDELRVLAVKKVVTHEGERDTTEVRTTAEAANHDIRIFASHLHLLLSLQADDGLVQTYVVKH